MKNKIKILITEDSPEWIKFHLNLLNQFTDEDNFEIDYEMSAKAGFNRILESTKAPYDLIISDLEMEDILGESYAGQWFVRNILKKKEEYKNSKIIIISGSPDIHTVAKDLNVDFIPKHLLAHNPLLLNYKLEELLCSS